MLIYNLTEQVLEYRGRLIPPHGGFIDLPLTFIPDRDRKLEEAKKMAFGRLPKWWHLEQELKTVLPPAPPPRKSLPVSDEVVAVEQVRTSKRFK
jgi:hypothetical protein